MGERKGQNKYYPPDYDPKKGGLNKWQGTHALRERARKLHLGILIIRFEMPFNVWCEGCGNHVGMGVRYNAEKKKVGMYYTTPLYEFKMKCHLCTNHFIIRTDPKNFDYELVEGLSRQEKRWDMASNEQVASSERETSNKLSTDAMFKLEHSESDLAKSKALAPGMQKLEQFQNRWKDDFARNQELRRIFRTSKKEANARTKADADLLLRSSLNVELLPENEDDVKLASMMTKYKTVQTSDEIRSEILHKLDSESIFYGQKASTSKIEDAEQMLKFDCRKASSIAACLLRKRPRTSALSCIDQLKDHVRKSALNRKVAILEHGVDAQHHSISNGVKINRKSSAEASTISRNSARHADLDKYTETEEIEKTKANDSDFDPLKNSIGLSLICQTYKSSSGSESGD